MTLLEVVLSLAIFLFSLAVISEFVTMSTNHVLDSNIRSEAVLLCQSKMAEVLAGSEPLTGGGDFAAFPDNANVGFEWKVKSEAREDAQGAYNVDVFVRRNVAGRDIEVSLTQVVFDPTKRGSTLDQPIPMSTATTPSSSGSSSGSSGSSSGSPGSGGS